MNIIIHSSLHNPQVEFYQLELDSPGLPHADLCKGFSCLGEKAYGIRQGKSMDRIIITCLSGHDLHNGDLIEQSFIHFSTFFCLPQEGWWAFTPGSGVARARQERDK
jgi:hypothetical protein